MKDSQIMKISEIIENEHNKNIDNFGATPYKMSADDNYLMFNLVGKISLICSLMKDKGVIDIFSYEVCNSYALFKLSKNGISESVEVVTNGKVVIFIKPDIYGLNIIGEENPFLKFSNKRLFYSQKNEQEDLERIAKELVIFVHETIYRLRDCHQVRFKEMLIEGQPEDL